MIVVIYASDRATPMPGLIHAVASSGGVVDDLCGRGGSCYRGGGIRSWGVEILDIPAAAAEACATAYRRYRERRRQESGKDSPVTPLPDFFIGAHAQVMGWTLATADESRFTTYFPSVRLLTPHTA